VTGRPLCLRVRAGGRGAGTRAAPAAVVAGNLPEAPCHFDYLKIDGEFIRNLAASSTDQSILKSIVEMAEALGKRTVAEFVGNQRSIELLREPRKRAGFAALPAGTHFTSARRRGFLRRFASHFARRF
jgi:hypothetical protein